MHLDPLSRRARAAVLLTLGLVSALIDARLSGRYQEEEWQRACR